MTQISAGLHVSHYNADSCVEIDEKSNSVHLKKIDGTAPNSFSFDVISFTPTYSVFFAKIVNPIVKQFFIEQGKSDVVVLFYGDLKSDKRELFQYCVNQCVTDCHSYAHDMKMNVPLEVVSCSSQWGISGLDGKAVTREGMINSRIVKTKFKQWDNPFVARDEREYYWNVSSLSFSFFISGRPGALRLIMLPNYDSTPPDEGMMESNSLSQVLASLSGVKPKFTFIPTLLQYLTRNGKGEFCPSRIAVISSVNTAPEFYENALRACTFASSLRRHSQVTQELAEIEVNNVFPKQMELNEIIFNNSSCQKRELESLKRYITDVDPELLQPEAPLSLFVEALRQKEGELFERETLLEKKVEELEVVRQELTEIGSTASSQAQHHDKMLSEISSLEKQIRMNKKKVMELRFNIEQMQQEGKKLQQEYDEAEEEAQQRLKDIKKQIINAQKTLDKDLEKQCNPEEQEAFQALEKIEERNRQYEAEFQTMRTFAKTELNKLHSDKEGLEKDVADLQENLMILRNNEINSQQHLEQLDIDISDKELMLSETIQELAEKHQNIACFDKDLKEKCDQLEEELNEIKRKAASDFEVQQKKIIVRESTLNERLQKLQDAVKSSQKMYDDLKEKGKSYDAEYKANKIILSGELRKLNEEKNNLERENNALEMNLKDMTAREISFKRALQELEESVEEKRRVYGSVSKELLEKQRTTEERHQQLLNENEQLVAEIDEAHCIANQEAEALEKKRKADKIKYTKQIEDLQYRIKFLQTSHNELEEKERSYNAEVKAMKIISNGKLTELRGELTVLSTKIENNRQQLVAQEKQTNDFKKQDQEVIKHLEEIEETVNQKALELSELLQEFDIKQRECEKRESNLRHREHDLVNNLHSLQSKITEEEGKLENVTFDREQVQREIEKRYEQLKELEEVAQVKHEEIQRRLDDLFGEENRFKAKVQMEKEMTGAELKHLNELLKQLKEKIDKRKNFLKVVDAQSLATEEQLNALTKELEYRETLQKKLKDDETVTKKQCEELQEKKRILYTEYTDLQAKCSACNTELKEKKDISGLEISQLCESKVALGAEIDALEKRQNELKEQMIKQLEEARLDSEAISKSIEASKAELREKETALRDAKTRMEFTEKQEKDMAIRLQKLQEDIIMSEEKCNGMMELFHNTQKSFDEKQSEHKGKENELLRRKTELEGDVRALQEKFEIIYGNTEKAEQRLKTREQAMHKRIAELDAQLTLMQAETQTAQQTLEQTQRNNVKTKQRLQKEEEEMTQQHRALENKMTATEVIVSAVTEELKQERDKMEQMRSQYEEEEVKFQRQKADFQTEIAVLNANSEAATKLLEQAQKKAHESYLERERQEQVSLRRKVELDTDLALLQGQINIASRAFDQLQNDTEERYTAQAQWESEILSKKEQLDANIDVSEHKLASVNATLERAEQESRARLLQLSKREKDHQKRISDLEMEQELFFTQVEDAKKNLEQAQRHAEMKELQMKQQESETAENIAELETQLRNLDSQMNNRRNRHDKLHHEAEARLAHLQQQERLFTERKATLESEIMTTEAKAKGVAAALNQMQAEADQKQVKIIEQERTSFRRKSELELEIALIETQVEEQQRGFTRAQREVEKANRQLQETIEEALARKEESDTEAAEIQRRAERQAAAREKRCQLQEETLQARLEELNTEISLAETSLKALRKSADELVKKKLTTDSRELETVKDWYAHRLSSVGQALQGEMEGISSQFDMSMQEMQQGFMEMIDSVSTENTTLKRNLEQAQITLEERDYETKEALIMIDSQWKCMQLLEEHNRRVDEQSVRRKYFAMWILKVS